MFLIKKFVLYYQVFGMTGIYYFVVSILLKKEKTVAVFPLPPLEVRAEGEKSSRHSPAWTIVNAGPKGYDRLAMKERRGSAGGFWELLSPRFFWASPSSSACSIRRNGISSCGKSGG